jgi:hypothetical protein
LRLHQGKKLSILIATSRAAGVGVIDENGGGQR